MQMEVIVRIGGFNRLPDQAFHRDPMCKHVRLLQNMVHEFVMDREWRTSSAPAFPCPAQYSPRPTDLTSLLLS